MNQRIAWLLMKVTPYMKTISAVLYHYILSRAFVKTGEWAFKMGALVGYVKTSKNNDNTMHKSLEPQYHSNPTIDAIAESSKGIYEGATSFLPNYLKKKLDYAVENAFAVHTKRLAEIGVRSLAVGVAFAVANQPGLAVDVAAANVRATSIALKSLAITVVTAACSYYFEQYTDTNIKAIKSYAASSNSDEFSAPTSELFYMADYVNGMSRYILYKTVPEALGFLANAAIGIYITPRGVDADAIRAAAIPAVLSFVFYGLNLQTVHDNHDLPMLREVLYKTIFNYTNTSELNANYDCSNAVSQPDVTVLDQLAHAVAYGECTRIVHDETTEVAGETPVIGTEEL